MNFPVDVTSYLTEGGGIGGRGERVMTTMTLVHSPILSQSCYLRGLDCVSHEDILPFVSSERSSIDHDLAGRIFNTVEETNGDLQCEREEKREREEGSFFSEQIHHSIGCRLFPESNDEDLDGSHSCE